MVHGPRRDATDDQVDGFERLKARVWDSMGRLGESWQNFPGAAKHVVLVVIEKTHC